MNMREGFIKRLRNTSNRGLREITHITKPKDRDFIETQEGMLFCVVGYLHPPERVTAYLKYRSSDEGKWSRGDISYTRTLPFYHVSQVEGTYKYLQDNHPEYLFYCPVRSIQVSTVPKYRVKKYYKPQERLQEILKYPQDSLEKKLSDLITILSGLSGLSTREFGVTGSILTSTHNPSFSDIDLTVYGIEASRALKKVILEMRGMESVIQPFNAAKKEVWSMNRSSRFPLSFRDLMEFAERRWNYGIFRDTYFSIHPVRLDGEIIESYGETMYTSIGEVSGTAIIQDARESIFLPAVYHITEVDTPNAVSRLVSFESLYSDMFQAGERVEFNGKLEKTIGPHGTDLQVVIGGAGSQPSYIRRLVASQP
jgi:predicted nucleotidyltransferase